MKIYLDNCTLNRHFDDQTQIKIFLETQAKLYIQEKIILGEIDLAWSYIIDFENLFNPYEDRKQFISTWKSHSKFYTTETNEIIVIANSLFNLGIKTKDALHLACAINLNCDYFITTDALILKKTETIKDIKIINPMNYIQSIEGQ